jgi:hypothetical protein
MQQVARAWWRSAAATLTGPARLSTPITRLRRAAMTPGWRRYGPEASSAKVTSRTWCNASMAQCPRTQRGTRAGDLRPPSAGRELAEHDS